MQEEKSTYTVCLAGNPNVGKSTIFNSLTGMHQHTGNWPGKTVANARGNYTYHEKKYELVDIPGTYSLMSHSEEEEIARDYLCFAKPDCTIVVVDATCLERNLNLVHQILEITNKVVVCVNLLDEARKKGIEIDFNKLEKRLGVSVIGTIARKKHNLKKLMQEVEKVCRQKKIAKTEVIRYPQAIEEAIEIVEKAINTEIEDNKLARWVSIKLLDGNEKILQSIENNLGISVRDVGLKEAVEQAREVLKNDNIDKNNFIDKIVACIMYRAEDICNDVVKFKRQNYNETDRKIDKVLTSKVWGIPIMLAFLGVIFWITITGANYPSAILSNLFTSMEEWLKSLFWQIGAPEWLIGVLIEGMFRTASWVIAVMLPPMAIFFPLFTLLEDLGYLPRIAFNLDNFFRKACTTGKQALTMCMGFGCNAAGIVGCRIIDSPREKIIAMLTNSFVPCNGRFPMLITIATIFIGSLFTGPSSSIVATLTVLAIIVFGIWMTLFISKILSKTILKGLPSSFILELPPYRKPQLGKVIVRSVCDKVIFVLGRAISIAAPAGIVIWVLANVCIDGVTLLNYIANFLNPFAQLMGLDGYILTAFILALPANEIVLPIILMSYMANGSLIDIEDLNSIGNILVRNGWTILTAINVMLFSLLHFPCSTTLLTIKKESGSWKWSILAFLLPTLCGIVVCMITTAVYNIGMNILG